MSVTDGVIGVTDINVSGPVGATMPITSVAHGYPAGHRPGCPISGGAFGCFELKPALLASSESNVQVTLDGVSLVRIPHL